MFPSVVDVIDGSSLSFHLTETPPHIVCATGKAAFLDMRFHHFLVQNNILMTHRTEIILAESSTGEEKEP